MSESSINLSITFSDVELAEDIEKILIEAKNQVQTSSENGNEFYLHDFLNQQNKTMGISFDSWWVPITVEREYDILNVNMVGSPSGTEEQDLITWFKLLGADHISGEISVDSGADIETWEEQGTGQ